jgi:transcriptional regulator with XRE-family HTH domain
MVTMNNKASQEQKDATAVLFGQLLRDFRQRVNLSQRRLAALLGVDESTVARIEVGARKPPRNLEFYEKLRTVPGITEAEVAALLNTDNAPRWLKHGQPQPTSQPDGNFARVSVGGFHVDIRVSADEGIAHEGEVDHLQATLVPLNESFLREFLHLRAQAQHEMKEWLERIERKRILDEQREPAREAFLRELHEKREQREQEDMQHRPL